MAFKAPNTLGTTVEVAEIESLALGAMIVGDGTGAPSTLTIGSNGGLIQALSSESTGVIWRTSPQMVDAIDWTTGVSATAGDYSILRNNDTTNRLQLNAPQGSMIELSINDQAQILVSEEQIDFQNNLIAMQGVLTLGSSLEFSSSTAIGASKYQIARDADSPNQLHFNVPTGATFEWSVNDAVEMTLSASAVNFQNNSITTTGGGSLTGTWSDLGTVTTVDINGGTIDGVTIGGAVAGAITGTTITATSFIIGANTLDTTEWANLDGQNQTVATTSSPTFVNLTITSFAANWTNAGRTVADLGIVTTVDINGGTVDGVTIGASSAGAGTFTSLIATSLDLNGALDLDVAGLGATVTNTTDGASVQSIILEGDRATVADGDEAYITFRLSDSGGNQDEQARLTWKATTVLSGATQDGDLIVGVLVNNVLTTMLTFDGSANEIVPAVAINSAAAITGTTITATSIVIGANTITTAEWANLDGLNQTVATTSSPTFVNLTITSFAANWTNAARTVADLGIVTTVDLNGGTIDGVTIGGASAGAGTFTALVGTSLDLNGALDLDVAALGATITNTADAASSQVMILEGDRATMADADEAYLTLRLSNDAGTQTEFARITWVGTDVNAGTSVDGRLDFSVVTAGALAVELQLDGTTLGLQTNTITGIGSAITGTAATALTISVPNTVSGAGANLTIQAGSAGGAGDNAGGDILLKPGADTANGAPGSVDFYAVGGTLALAWSDYSTNDSLWGADAGDITYFGIFAGPPTLDFAILRVASSANYLRVEGAAASSEPILSAQGSDTDISITLTPKGAGDVVISTGGLAITAGRIQGVQGADVASATNLTLLEGNVFELTGTTKVDLISNVGWQEGSVVTLIANESVVIDHGTVSSGANIQILLGNAGADRSLTANDTLTLVLSSTTAGGQAWREVAFSAN